MKNLIVFPVVLVVVILQTSIISRLSLLSGFADIMLLLLAGLASHKNASQIWLWGVVGSFGVGFVSGAPFIATLIGYLAVIGLARLIQQRVWESPVMAMFLVTFIGTLLFHLITYVSLLATGVLLSFDEVFSYVTLPSLFINMLLAIPVYTVVRDLAGWLYVSEQRV